MAKSDPTRQFFDKVMGDPNASMDGTRFISALLSYEDPVELVYRLTSTKEHGAKCLRAALSSSDTATFITNSVVRFLDLLGSDQLTQGTCKESVSRVIDVVYRVPGLLKSISSAIKSESRMVPP